MSAEEDIRSELIRRSGLPDDKVRIQRKRRIYMDVPIQNFTQILGQVVKDLKFSILCAITGLDEGETLALIYHMAQKEGAILNIKTGVPKNNPLINTITNLFPGADIYERELADLFGVKVEGLPEGNRYPLPDDWPKDQFPLRKDWKTNASDKGEVK